VPLGATSSSAESELPGRVRWAINHASWALSATSNSSGVRSSADSRAVAVWQKLSSAREMRRCWSELNFVGCEKSSVRTDGDAGVGALAAGGASPIVSLPGTTV